MYSFPTRNFVKATLLGIGAIALTATASIADIIHIKSVQSGKFVTVEGGLMQATAERPGNSDRFELVRLQGNRIAFKHVSSGTYVRAGIGQDTLLGTGSPHIRGWEIFELHMRGGQTFNLKSVQNGKWVRAGLTQRSKLAAVTVQSPSSWEKFEFVKPQAANAAATPTHIPQLSELNGTWSVHSVVIRGNYTKIDRNQLGHNELTFSNGSLSFYVGCNTNNTSYSLANGRINFSAVIGTKRGCHGHAGDVEFATTQAIANTTQIRARGRYLYLYDRAADKTVLLYK